MGDKSTAGAEAANATRKTRSTGQPEPVPRRLVVELGSTTAAELTDLLVIEDLNKTTIVNRALQLYALVRKSEMAGGKFYLRDPESDDLERIRFI